ncbi:MAG: radical SAM protein, partial [Desulfobacterales bacterium]
MQNDPFIIRHTGGRTRATIKGLPAGGRKPDQPLILPVFIPMGGCPHRCLYCDQTAITGTSASVLSRAAVEKAIQKRLPAKNRPDRPVQIAFYGGNFLGLPAHRVRDLLTVATAYVSSGRATGIRFSTRPDTITAKTLALLRDFPVDTIELGLQSMDDRVLACARRGHDAACTVAAAQRIKSAGFRLGLQMMTDLPGDTPQGAMATAIQMVSLAPDLVRIYPTLVLEGSRLARRYRSGAYIPMALPETIALVSRLYLVFTAAHIPVIRMGLQTDEALTKAGTILAGPYHPAFGEQVFSHVFYGLAEAALVHHPRGPSAPGIRVHPRRLSQMLGTRRGNLQRLARQFG